MMRKALAILFALAACSSATAQNGATGPASAETSVCRPEFTVEGVALNAGTGFLVGVNGKTYLVSAQHLFGEGGGLPREIPWQEMPSRVSGVRCSGFADGRVWSAGSPIAIAGAAAGTDVEAMNDIAAFPIALDADSSARALRLATAPAKVGDTVWLVTRLLRGAPETKLLHRAEVGRVTGGGTLLFVYDDPSVEIQATSGAPIVNARGEVVGVNFGGLTREGRTIGIATGLAAVRAALTAPAR